jgi:hypothetical protein
MPTNPTSMPTSQPTGEPVVPHHLSGYYVMGIVVSCVFFVAGTAAYLSLRRMILAIANQQKVVPAPVPTAETDPESPEIELTGTAHAGVQDEDALKHMATETAEVYAVDG